jgi:hypothetical protein
MRRPGGTAEVAGHTEGFSVEQPAPARGGDERTATVVELAKTGRNGAYDLEVVNT